MVPEDQPALLEEALALACWQVEIIRSQQPGTVRRELFMVILQVV
jgi:hypothetical protein